jgi:hypothetical protein
MIDSVIVRFPISPTLIQLQDWISHPLIFPNGEKIPKYFQNTKMINGTVISCKYYPPNPPHYPLPWLGIQVSLPKVLYGNNIELITGISEIEGAICKINQFIGEKSWLPNLDFRSGLLWQVDLVYDHQVGDQAQDYIRALYKLDYKMRKTQPYPHEGVQFKSNVASTKFYDKYIESSSSLAIGTLRQETTLRHTYYIGRQMGTQYPTLNDISVSWVSTILKEDLQKLHLLGCIITDCSSAQARLVQNYGWNHGDKLFGHLYARQSMSKKQMVANGKNKRTIRKYEKQITDAGVSLTLAEDCIRLPSLNIQMQLDTSMPDNLSDT